jgi:ubiquitin fusion degradation protein 1
MLFRIDNKSKSTHTHCGVLEFSAEEGRVYIPFWMQEHLQLSPGQLVTVTNATLPKGTYAKIRPQQKAFIEISDPRAVLEKKLRNFSCLSKGDTIIINYNDTNFFIDIMDVAAAKSCEAISIVETDVRVDFDRPLDMPPSPVNTTPPDQQIFERIPRGVAPSQQQQQQQPPVEEPSFQAFKGEGRRLDGKTAKKSMVSNVQPPTTTTATTTTQPSPSTQTSTTPLGVVGKKRRKYGDGQTPSTTTPSTASTTTATTTTTTTEDTNKFKAFSGTGRSLK